MEPDEEDAGWIMVYVSIICGLVVMAGLMSGLTLGLMSLDLMDLEVFKRSGTPQEQVYAAKIMPVIKRQHFLLVTLLLCNAAATEALPIFLDRLVHPITAVIISVTVVLVFGEIIPQAICSRYGLQVGAYSAPFVKALMLVCSPVAWPISKLLDFVLGPDHKVLFRRSQLKALVDLHSAAEGLGGTLTEDEIHIIRGALDMTTKTAERSMTPLDKVFMLAMGDVLDEKTMQAILMSGHSRIPVYGISRKDIRGLILVKELVLVNPAAGLLVGDMKVREAPRLPAATPMYDMLKLFESGRTHFAVLTSELSNSGEKARTAPAQPKSPKLGRNSYGYSYSIMSEPLPPGSVEEPVGIITIEDVIEELLQEEIIDETDNYVDNLQTSRVNAAAVAGSLPPRLRQALSAGIFTPRVGRMGAMPKAGIMALGRVSDSTVYRAGRPDRVDVTTSVELRAGGMFPAPSMPLHAEWSGHISTDMEAQTPLLLNDGGPTSTKGIGVGNKKP